MTRLDRFLLPDPENKDYIIHSNGPGIISSLLLSSDEETVLSSITTLMFLVTPYSKAEITSPRNINLMINFTDSTNYRLKNLALVFLNDYCDSDDVERVKSSRVSDIPLPI